MIVDIQGKKQVKELGMVNIKGVNDKEYAEYIASLKPAEPLKEIAVLPNRW